MNEENSLTPEQKAAEAIEKVEDNFLERGFPNLPHDLKAELLDRKTKEYEEEREKERTQMAGVWKAPESDSSANPSNPMPDHLKEALSAYDEIANKPKEGLGGTSRVGRKNPTFGVNTEPQNPDHQDEEESQDKEGDDWQKLSELRRFAALLEESGKDRLSPEDVKNLGDYEKYKKEIAEKIKYGSRERLKSENPDLVEGSEEFDIRLKGKISQELSDFYFAEYERVKSARREIRKETVLGRVEEGAREKLVSFMNTKIMKSYLGMNKWARLGLTTTLFVMGGYALGTAAVGASLTSAAAYGAGRLARGAGSIVAGGVVRGYAEKKWSEEDLNKEFEAKKNTIEMTAMPNNERESKIKELKIWEEERRKEIRRNKMLVALGTGMGANLIATLTEFDPSGTSTSSESFIQKVEASETKPLMVEAPDALRNLDDTAILKKAVDLHQKMGEIDPEKIFEDPAILNQEVTNGDSVWKLLGKTVEKSSLFKGLTGDPDVIEAKKTFILNNLINEHNLTSKGSLKVGERLDFTEVFEDKGKIQEIFKKAEVLSESKIKNTLENNAKIETWVRAHPGEPLTPDKVSEILSQKAELKTFAFNQEPVQANPPKSLDESISQAKLEEPNLNNLQKKVVNNLDNNEKLVTSLNEGDLKVASESKTINNIGFQETEVPDEIQVASQASAASTEAKVVNIEDYRNGGVRSMQGDSRRLVAEIVSNEKIEEHLRNDINNIYGKKGIFGIGKVEGVKTKEWGEISGQNAAKVIDFYNNPDKSDLPKKVIETLTISQQNRNLVEYMDFLRGEARTSVSGFVGIKSSDVAPYENETVVEYLKRLGKFIMEHPKPEVQNSVTELKKVA